MIDQSLPKHVDIAIIGAGLAGASTAYYLKQFGAKSVVIIEKEQVPGLHSSGKNASMIRSAMTNASVQILADESMPILCSGELADFQQVGSFLIGHGSEDCATDYCSIAQGRGTYNSNDGVIDVHGLLGTYLKDQHLICNTEVLNWQALEEEIVIETTQGNLCCKQLVNAAGPWAGELGDLPLQPF